MNWKKGIKKIKNKLEDMLKQINEEDMKKSNDYIKWSSFIIIMFIWIIIFS